MVTSRIWAMAIRVLEVGDGRGPGEASRFEPLVLHRGESGVRGHALLAEAALVAQAAQAYAEPLGVLPPGEFVGYALVHGSIQVHHCIYDYFIDVVFRGL